MRMIRRMRLVDYFTEKKMAYTSVAPSIESLLQLAPEDPESWVLGLKSQSESHWRAHVERAADGRVHCVGERREPAPAKELWARLPPPLRPRAANKTVFISRQLRPRSPRRLAEKPIVRPMKRGAFTGAAGRKPRCISCAGGRGRHRVPRRSRRNGRWSCSPSCCACSSNTK